MKIIQMLVTSMGQTSKLYVLLTQDIVINVQIWLSGVSCVTDCFPFISIVITLPSTDSPIKYSNSLA